MSPLPDYIWQILLKQVRPKLPWKRHTALWRWERPVSFLTLGRKTISPACCFRRVLFSFLCSHFNILDDIMLKITSELKLSPFFIHTELLLNHVFVQLTRFCILLLSQIFPSKVDPRWHGPPPSQLSLALQQALAKELMRAKQGQIQQGGLAFRLLQAFAALLTSTHAGPVVISMHHSHALSCPLMRQLYLYQVRLAYKSVHNSKLQGSHGHGKPGKVMEIVNGYFQAWKSP